LKREGGKRKKAKSQFLNYTLRSALSPIVENGGKKKDRKRGGNKRKIVAVLLLKTKPMIGKRRGKGFEGKKGE